MWKVYSQRAIDGWTNWEYDWDCDKVLRVGGDVKLVT